MVRRVKGCHIRNGIFDFSKKTEKNSGLLGAALEMVFSTCVKRTEKYSGLLNGFTDLVKNDGKKMRSR